MKIKSNKLSQVSWYDFFSVVKLSRLRFVLWNLFCFVSFFFFPGQFVRSASIEDLTYIVGDSGVEITECSRSASGHLEIPRLIEGSPVIGIGDGAFSNCLDLTSVVLPGTVTRVGRWAFEVCRGLTRVVIPNSVREIEEWAFSECSALTEFDLGNSVQYIGDYCFAACLGLEMINVAPGNAWFSDIDGILFDRGGTRLIAYPGGRGNPHYEISKAVFSIAPGALGYCRNLKRITVEEGSLSFSGTGGVLFNFEGTELFTVPAGKIGTYEMPEGVTRVGKDGFWGCYRLTSVVIPDTVTSVGDFAFDSCTDLEMVAVGGNVTSFGNLVFLACNRLTGVWFLADTTQIPLADGSNIFGEMLLWDGEEELKIYAASDGAGWGDKYADKYNDIPITYILTLEEDGQGDLTVTNCLESTPGDLVVASEIGGRLVASIGDLAFFDCNKISSVSFPATVRTIGDYIFGGCINLKEINVDSRNESFSDSQGILFNKEKTVLIAYPMGREAAEYVVPRQVTGIEPGALNYCKNLAAILVSEGNAYFSSVGGALFDAEKFKLIVFPAGKGGQYNVPNGVSLIADDAFWGSDQLTSVNIPQTVTFIGDFAFESCSGLTDVVIPGSVNSVGDLAFALCSNLSDVTFTGNMPSDFGSEVFRESGPLTIYAYLDSTGWADSFEESPIVLIPRPLPIKLFAELTAVRDVSGAVEAVTISFASLAERNYTVEGSTDLRSWRNVEAGLPGTGDIMERTYSVDVGQQFFRVVLD